MSDFGTRLVLPDYLREWQEKIENHARSAGLDFFPQVFEILTFDEMNEVAAQNATLVQKAAASTDAMQRRAEPMVDVVSSFELGDHGAAGNGSSTRAPKPAGPQRALRALN